MRFATIGTEINEVLLRDVDGNEVAADLFSVSGRGRIAGSDSPRPLAEVESISADFGATPEGGVQIEIEIELPDGDGVGQRSAVLRLHLAPVSGRTKLVAISAPPTAGDLVEALASDRLYYSQQIWAGLPAHELAMALGGYSVAGEPLLEQVDPVPQGSYGIYLLFHWLREDSEWKSWEASQLEAARPTTQLVPIPTGGVFGEAILGRFNASEKLDISRFWNCQDSPIPHAAPEIAPAATGSRASDPGLTSPQFGAPIVNLMSPGAMPAPGTVGQLAASMARWQVWAQAAGGGEETLDALWWDSGTVRTERITTRVIDFTAHAAMRGFVPISPRNCWPGDYRCGEWWHFQHEGDTVPYISQLGAERIRARGGDFVDGEIAGAAARWDEIKMLIRGTGRSWSD